MSHLAVTEGPDKDLIWLPVRRSTNREMKPKKNSEKLVGKKETGAI